MSEHWTTSTYSGPDGGNCVECRTGSGRVDVRDSRHPALGHLSFPAHEWRALVGAVRAGEL